MTDRAVLFSIKPKYCELIASGKKTVEVQKTRPKIPTPFRGLIYCTKGETVYFPKDIFGNEALNGKVIGEFVCDAIFPISIKYSNPESRLALKEFPFTCLTDKQIIDYLGNGKEGYALHISNLVIYDKPKELSEFCFPPERYCEKGLCGGCPYDQVPNEYGEYEFDCEWKRPIIRPPQSWCYVEEMR